MRAWLVFLCAGRAAFFGGKLFDQREWLDLDDESSSHVLIRKDTEEGWHLKITNGNTFAAGIFFGLVTVGLLVNGLLVPHSFEWVMTALSSTVSLSCFRKSTDFTSPDLKSTSLDRSQP